jgi:cytochrome c biogenesis protein CcdA
MLDLAVPLSPGAALDAAFEQIAGGELAAVAFGLAAGVVLGLSPVALPALPAVATVLSPTLQPQGALRRELLRAAPRVTAFVVGMDVPLAMLGYLFSAVSVALARASVVLSLVSALLLMIAGLWMLLRRHDACVSTRRLPTHPMDALAYGVAFSVTACSGCAPLLIGLGSAVALVGGPASAGIVLVFFLAGRVSVMLATAALGGRLLVRPGGVRIFDVLVGVSLLGAAAYHTYLVATGRVSAVLPGEPGSTVLP